MPMAIVPPVEMMVILFSAIRSRSIKHYGSDLPEQLLLRFQVSALLRKQKNRFAPDVEKDYTVNRA